MFNICLTPSSYYGLPEAQEVADFIKQNTGYRYEHEHRKWEYGQALQFIRQHDVKTVLNVGGGNSPLSSMLAREGREVTEIDPNPPSRTFAGIKYINDKFPKSGLGKFDAVISTSVIEHVQTRDIEFFTGLLDSSSSLVFLTTDFHPSGVRFSQDHYRTYDKAGMLTLIGIAKTKGFQPADDPSYVFEVPMVYNYTFASLALWKK